LKKYFCLALNKQQTVAFEQWLLCPVCQKHLLWQQTYLYETLKPIYAFSKGHLLVYQDLLSFIRRI